MKTEIIAITDRSGSMASLAGDVIGGFNTFLKEQQAVPGEGRMTFTQFDNEYEIVYAGKALADAPTLTAETYVPRGGTALLDAIGRTLNEQGARIKAEGWADLVIICVITDGAENASREFEPAKIREMVKHAETHGWKFIYLAANLDAAQLATSLGNQHAFTQNFAASAAGMRGAYAGTSATVSNYRGAP